MSAAMRSRGSRAGPRPAHGLTVRGAIDADARPNWNERVPATLFALQVGPGGHREQELLK